MPVQKKTLWLIVITGAVLAAVAGTRMLGHKQYLSLPSSPAGIVSLEVARTNEAAESVVSGWKKDTLDNRIYSECKSCSPFYTNRDPELVRNSRIDRVQMARSDIWLDFLFILGYVTLAGALMLLIENGAAKPLPGLIALPVLAGVFDSIENIGMLGFVPAGPFHFIPAGVYSLFALAKFSLAVALLGLYVPLRLYQLGYLKKISAWIEAKTHQLWRYRAIILTIALFAFPLWLSDQGQDLLININGSEGGVALFLGLITMAALLNWWLAKLFFSDSYCGPVLPLREQHLSDDEKWKTEKKASHFFGVMTFVLPAFGILQALKDFRISYFADFFLPVIWLAGVTVLYYVLIQSNAIVRIYQHFAGRAEGKQKIDRRVLVIMAGPPLVVVLMRFVALFRVGTVRSPVALTFLSLDLVLLSISFLIFVSLRTYMFPDRNHRLRDRLGYPIFFAAFGSAVLFLVANCVPVWFSTRLTWNYICLPVLFCGLVFYLLFFTLVLRLSRWKSVNFVTLLITLCFLANLAVKSPFHDVRFLDTQTADSLPRPALRDYIAQWVMHRARAGEIDSLSRNTYPVFLVNAYGGGIKAAAFTDLVIRHLDDSVKKFSGRARPFEHFILSWSGASGGTIGLGVLSAYRYAELKGDHPAPMTDSMLAEFYNRDFLTTLIIGVLGRDVWAAGSATHFWDDRSVLQERIWETNMKNFWRVNFGNDFYGYWPTEKSDPAAYEVPLLFSNTANVDDGLKGVIAPVNLDSSFFPATEYLARQIPARRSIALSTASFLSARFPFISPIGRTSDNFHFTDGGMVDNSGAGTSESVARQIWSLQGLTRDSLEKISPGLYPYLRKIAVNFVSISNSSHSQSGAQQKVANLFQLSAPLTGLLNSSIDGNAKRADMGLRYGYPGRYISIWPDVDCIPLKDSTRSFSPALPLGWQISAPALERLDSSVTLRGYYDHTGDSIPGFGRIMELMRQ